MPEFTVYLTQSATTAIRVEADTPEGALELAYQTAPGGLCAKCTGLGNPPGVSLAGQWEPEEVVDEDGATVWPEPTETPMPTDPHCVATGDPDLHECDCQDCCEVRWERDQADREMGDEY